MDNTDRAETVQPWLTKQKSHEIFRFTASTVDIPTRWNPRAKQQPTGLIACGAMRRRPVRAPSIAQTKKKKRKTSTQCVLVFLGAMEGTRTPGLLIRRNRIAHFVHFIIQRQIAILIELPLFCRCYSIVFFALLARFRTYYPSLRCAENVQKCAEPKSARQDGLKMSDFPAGFLRHQQHKNS
ncbi:hypothetical protein [Faecalibacterium prausnitzii]|uniref:hypothetical protein n=1 Tax=Faecalibacterium prausnitzii TaxID=853 RepID=UPI001FA9605A|nr:hypothetical protein [Faecalibacterium prausnitzii]